MHTDSRGVVFSFILGMNIFVAFFVLLILLADSTPPAAASIPLIGILPLNFHLLHCSSRRG